MKTPRLLRDIEKRTRPLKTRVKSSYAVDYGDDWSAISAECLRRHGNACAKCGRRGTRDNRLNAHHRISKAQGGDDSQANLVCLCETCHSAEHGGKVIDRSRGRR